MKLRGGASYWTRFLFIVSFHPALLITYLTALTLCRAMFSPLLTNFRWTYKFMAWQISKCRRPHITRQGFEPPHSFPLQDTTHFSAYIGIQLDWKRNTQPRQSSWNFNWMRPLHFSSMCVYESNYSDWVMIVWWQSDCIYPCKLG